MDQNGYNSRSTHQLNSSIGSTDPLDLCAAFPYTESPRSRDTLFFQPIHSALVGGIETYLDPKYITDPATFSSRLPFLPLPGNYAMYDWGFEPAFIRKRNERERQRVKCVNEGYARLREHLPQEYAEKRLSKVETLRATIQYIKHLQRLLGIENQQEYEKESLGERNNKMIESPGSSELDKMSEDNFAKYLEDEDDPLSTTSSSRGEHSSTPSVDNEDSLTSPASPKVKVEASLPSDFLQTAENLLTLHRQRSPYGYPYKGKVFCKASHTSLKTQDSKSNWRNPTNVNTQRNVSGSNACLLNQSNLTIQNMGFNVMSETFRSNMLNFQSPHQASSSENLNTDASQQSYFNSRNLQQKTEELRVQKQAKILCQQQFEAIITKPSTNGY